MWSRWTQGEFHFHVFSFANLTQAQVSEVAGSLSPDGVNTLKQASHALIDAATVLKRHTPTRVLSLSAPTHCSLICFTCLGKSSRYFCVQTSGSVLCYSCKKNGTLCLPIGYLYSFPFWFWWFQIPQNCWLAVAELCKEYTEVRAIRDPTLLDKAAKHAKMLHNRINSACFDAKHWTESQTLLAELVHLNCLVAMLLLKQVSSGIATVLCTILTVSGRVGSGACDLSVRASWWPWRWQEWDGQGW